VLGDRGIKKPYTWWGTHEAACTILQQLDDPLLGYFILLLREELEHRWEFAHIEEKQA
jgi:hypothetical protein